MSGMVDYGIINPALGGSFGAGYNASRQNRMAAEEQQSNLDQLKSDRQTMTQLQEQLKAAGKDPDLNKVFDALIATGRPDYVTHGIEGKQRLKAQMDFERTGRDLYPELFGGAAAAPQPAPPAPQPPTAPALGTGMFGTGVSMNALAPAAAATAPTTNALAPTAAAPTNAMAKTPDQLRREIMFFSQSSDPRAKAMVGTLTSQLSEITKPYVVGGNLVTGAGQTLFTATPTAQPTPLSRLYAERDALPPNDPRRASYDALIRKETTHSPGTTVNVSTGKKYGETFASNLADADMGKMTAAEKAPQLAESANRIIDLVKQGNVFTGPAADIKLNIARVLNVAGADNNEKIANTEALVAATGQSTLDSIKSAGLGTGQGFTDKDLKFLQGIAGGTIGLTSQTLTRLAELQHRTATRSAESWNSRLQQLPKEVLQGTGLSSAPIKVPELRGGASNVVVTPDGQSHTFPTSEAAAKFKKAAGL